MELPLIDSSPGRRELSPQYFPVLRHSAGCFQALVLLRQGKDLLGQGIAVVLPATADSCRYCHLQTFCRIGEGSSRNPDSETLAEDGE